MATAAFRSTSKRASIGSGPTDDSRSSASSRRRARSVSRFSHRLPSESSEFVDQATAETPAVETRGKFVNKARGTAFPEISLDDLAIELFSSGERGKASEVSTGTASSQRRGRSVSRQASSRVAGERKSVAGRSNGGGGGSAFTGGKAALDRRRRSLSVVRYRASDSESDNSEKYSRQINNKSFSHVNKQEKVHKPTPSAQQRGLRRSSSQRDFLASNNGYSSYSSVLTDDETQDVQYVDDDFESFRAINARKKAEVHNDAREVKRNELRHSIDAIKVSHQQMRGSADLSKRVKGGGLPQKDIGGSRFESYSAKLEQSEKRKQELHAQIMLEQHLQERTKFVGEWLPAAKETCASKRMSRPRKRSSDRRRISNLLNEEADKIIEDFISSVEDTTDISSFDGERSDTSSTIGPTARQRDALIYFGEPENYRSPTRLPPAPVQMDGVVLPWLKWETSESPPRPNDKKQTSATLKTVLPHTVEATNITAKTEQSNQSNSSRGSWSPAAAESISVDSQTSKTTAKPAETRKSTLLTNLPRRSRAVDIDDYLATQSNDEVLFEKWKLGPRISSSGILICEGLRGPILL